MSVELDPVTNDLEQGVDDLGIELGAFSGQQLRAGGPYRLCRAVRTIRRHRVVNPSTVKTRELNEMSAN